MIIAIKNCWKVSYIGANGFLYLALLAAIIIFWCGVFNLLSHAHILCPCYVQCTMYILFSFNVPKRISFIAFHTISCEPFVHPFIHLYLHMPDFNCKATELSAYINHQWSINVSFGRWLISRVNYTKQVATRKCDRDKEDEFEKGRNASKILFLHFQLPLIHVELKGVLMKHRHRNVNEQ